MNTSRCPSVVLTQKRHQRIRTPYLVEDGKWKVCEHFSYGVPDTDQIVFWGDFVDDGTELLIVHPKLQLLFYQQYTFTRLMPLMLQSHYTLPIQPSITFSALNVLPLDQNPPSIAPRKIRSLLMRNYLPGESFPISLYPRFYTDIPIAGQNPRSPPTQSSLVNPQQGHTPVQGTGNQEHINDDSPVVHRPDQLNSIAQQNYDLSSNFHLAKDSMSKETKETETYGKQVFLGESRARGASGLRPTSKTRDTQQIHSVNEMQSKRDDLLPPSERALYSSIISEESRNDASTSTVKKGSSVGQYQTPKKDAKASNGVALPPPGVSLKSEGTSRPPNLFSDVSSRNMNGSSGTTQFQSTPEKRENDEEATALPTDECDLIILSPIKSPSESSDEFIQVKKGAVPRDLSVAEIAALRGFTPFQLVKEPQPLKPFSSSLHASPAKDPAGSLTDKKKKLKRSKTQRKIKELDPQKEKENDEALAMAEKEKMTLEKFTPQIQAKVNRYLLRQKEIRGEYKRTRSLPDGASEIQVDLLFWSMKSRYYFVARQIVASKFAEERFAQHRENNQMLPLMIYKAIQTSEYRETALQDLVYLGEMSRTNATEFPAYETEFLELVRRTGGIQSDELNQDVDAAFVNDIPAAAPEAEVEEVLQDEDDHGDFEIDMRISENLKQSLIAHVRRQEIIRALPATVDANGQYSDIERSLLMIHRKNDYEDAPEKREFQLSYFNELVRSQLNAYPNKSDDELRTQSYGFALLQMINSAVIRFDAYALDILTKEAIETGNADQKVHLERSYLEQVFPQLKPTLT